MKILIFSILIFLLFKSSCVVAATAVEKVVVGYWGYWESERLPIEDIAWSQITHINYGFASMNEGSIPVLTNKAQLQKFVGTAHQNNVKALLSIGGWLGSKSMSNMASTAENRTQFVDTVVGWALEYGLDGIDIDWEHPGKSALECNMIDYSGDTDNFLLLLRQLRKELNNAFTTIRIVAGMNGSSSVSNKTSTNNNPEDQEGYKLLTAAVGTTPFFKNNAPIPDTSQFAEVLDWVFIMMYDTYAGKSIIGPNAPLQTSTQLGASSQSFAQAWHAWTTADMPNNKIVMGLPFYGYVSKPKEDAVKVRRLLVGAHSSRPQGDPDDTFSNTPCPGSKHGYSGLWKWKSLKTSGVLLDAKTPANQWIKNWDQESQTPWLYNPETRHLISYDDPDSIALKVKFAMCKEARGVGVWDLSFDAYDENKKGQLLTVVNQNINSSVGFDACSQLKPLPGIKIVGPNFNILTNEQIFQSQTSRRDAELTKAYLALALVLVCAGWCPFF